MAPSLPELMQRIRTTVDPAERATLCEQALTLLQRDDDPVAWASLQGGRSASIAEAVEGRFTLEVFDTVLAGYEAALTVFTQDGFADEWASTLRNIGRTHSDAAASALGDPQDHIETAISAFTEAADVSPEAAFDACIGARCDLAGALTTAAAWRGPDALDQAAGLYANVAEVFPRERSPEFWASLQMRCAESIAASGNLECADAAIVACDRALEVFTREGDPLRWATVHLLLGQLLRARRSIDASADLERAVASLDAALSVFTQEAFPQQWFEAHYHRGPALALCAVGDRNNNLRLALESLRIALSGISRDDNPDVWGALQVTLGQALLERTDGNSSEHIEQAIPALEAALAVLASAPASLYWRLANRFLGDAYLRREADDPEDNIERGISALEAVVGPGTSPIVDVDEWVSGLANLGHAYVQRRRGDAAENRAKAIAALEAALAVPLADDAPSQGWGAAQAWLTLLSMTEPGHQFERKRAAGDADGAKNGADHRHDRGDSPEGNVGADRDVADHDREDGIEAYAAFKRGDQPLAREPHWHVPFLLEDSALLLQRELGRFLDGGAIPMRSREKREEFEGDRAALVAQLVHHLDERRIARQRTESLFDEIRISGRPFVLYLRGFNNRISRFAEGAVVSGTGNLEWFALADLVASVAPMPVVWVANPVESSAIDLLVSGKQPEDMGFRIEAGEDWAQSVRTLAAMASFIVMDNGAMTPGVLAEIAMLQDLGRLDDAFFEDAAAASGTIGRACRPLDAAAITAMTSWTMPRLPTAPLPAAMCPWIGGERRNTLTREFTGVMELLRRLENGPRAVLEDLVLDTHAWLSGCATMLEREDLLVNVGGIYVNISPMN